MRGLNCTRMIMLRGRNAEALHPAPPRRPLNGWLKLLMILDIPIAILLPSYHTMVRYTWIGRILNGRANAAVLIIMATSGRVGWRLSQYGGKSWPEKNKSRRGLHGSGGDAAVVGRRCAGPGQLFGAAPAGGAAKTSALQPGQMGDFVGRSTGGVFALYGQFILPFFACSALLVRSCDAENARALSARSPKPKVRTRSTACRGASSRCSWAKRFVCRATRSLRTAAAAPDGGVDLVLRKGSRDVPRAVQAMEGLTRSAWTLCASCMA